MKSLVGALVLVMVLAVACAGSGEETVAPAASQQTPTPAAQPVTPAQPSATPAMQPAPADQPAAATAPAPTPAAQPAPQPTPAPAPAASPAAQPAEASAAVKATGNANLGNILTDDKGRTVYLRTNDDRKTPTCTGSCAQVWPPLTTSGAPKAGAGTNAALLGTVGASDGTMQVTYNGWPLYYFSRDAQPGDANGQATGGVWFVVSPAGEAVKPAPAPAPTSPQPAPAPAPTPAPTPAPQQPAPAVKTIAVEMANFSFKPAAINIKLGEAVRFAAANKDSVTHSFSFSVPGGGAYDVIVNGGQSKDGDPITINKAGNIQFFCQFHAGMIGSLDVAASSASPGAPPGDTSGYNY